MTFEQFLVAVAAFGYLTIAIWAGGQLSRLRRENKQLSDRLWAIIANEKSLRNTLLRHAEILAGLGVGASPGLYPERLQEARTESVGLVDDDEDTDEAERIESLRPILPSRLIQQKESFFHQRAVDDKARRRG